MGCTTSTNVHPSIYNETTRKQKHANGDLKPKKPPKCMNENSIRGDYTQYQLAKHNREKLHKDRQIKIFLAADEMSGKMMEEREMLSLGTRSRGTSRNTSRATSPNNNRRSIQFKDEQPMTPVAEDKLSRGASLRSLDKENSSPKRKHTSKKHSKTKGKTKKHKKGKKSKKGKGKALKEINESEDDEPDSGLEDEDENEDDINVKSVNSETVNQDVVSKVKPQNEINANGEVIVKTLDIPDNTVATASVISRRSVNDIAIHSASEDSGIAGTGLNVVDSSKSKTNTKQPATGDII